MQVRLTQQISGTRDGEKWPPPGTTIDVSDEEGTQLIAAGNATTTDPDDEHDPDARQLERQHAAVAASTGITEQGGDAQVREDKQTAETPEQTGKLPETREHKGHEETPESIAARVAATRQGPSTKNTPKG